MGKYLVAWHQGFAGRSPSYVRHVRSSNLLPLLWPAFDFLSALHFLLARLVEDLVGNDLADVRLPSLCNLHHSFVLLLIGQLLTGLFAFLKQH